MAEGPRRLTTIAIVIVAIGLAMVLSIVVAAGSGLTTLFYVAPVVLLGVLVVAAAVKTRAGSVRPHECSNCGGLISPNAPYCKHCGAPVE